MTDRNSEMKEFYHNSQQFVSVTDSGPAGTAFESSNDSQLCPQCSSIDVNEIFSREIGFQSSFVMGLGSIEGLEKSACAMCRFFASVAPQNVDHPSMSLSGDAKSMVETRLCHLRVFDATWEAIDPIAEEKHRQTNFLAVAPSDGMADNIFMVMDMTLAMEETGYLGLNLAEKTQRACQVRIIDPKAFDLKLAKNWISYCDKNHQTQCFNGTLSNLQHFQVIDCNEGQVIDAPEGCKFVALSYVWGKGNAPEVLLFPNKLATGARVIRDSISVTRKLGLRYLWVDKYCIDQHNNDDKNHQISQMDLIYANSTLTIIAAAGNGPDRGLPGINGTQRVQQPKFEHKGMTLVSTLPSAKYTFAKSKWYKRGWTFQEAMLPARRLIFTDDKVLFECNDMHCTEALDIPLNSTHRLQRALPVMTPGLDPQAFMKYVGDYSKRDLTCRCDALRAFQGILGAFSRAKRPVHHFWGIPIYLSDADMCPEQIRRGIIRSLSTRFTLNLFWRAENGSKGIVRTKLNFPTWSWTAWHGPIDKLPPTTFNAEKGYYADVKIILKDKCKITCECEKLASDHSPDCKNNSEYGLSKCNNALEYGHNWGDLDFINLSTLQNHYSGILQVQGWTIELKITQLNFTAEEKAKSSLKPGARQIQDGLYVNFRLGSRGTVYSLIDSPDIFRMEYPSEHTFMGFLSSTKGDNSYRASEMAMVLENCGGHYQRIGVFWPYACWKIDGDHIPRRVDRDLIKVEEFESVRKVFCLG